MVFKLSELGVKIKELIEPVAAQIDLENVVPEKVLAELGRLGAFRLIVPKEYGGLGLGFKEYIEVLEEVAGASVAVAHILLIHSGVVYGIVRYGSEELRKKYLSRLASGELIGSIAITEPRGGSDVVGSIELVAEKSDDGYRLNGFKVFNSNGIYAGLYLVLARTGPPEMGSKSLSMLLVERDTGIEPEPMDLTSLRGAGISKTRFTDVHIPDGNMLGSEGKGLRIALSIINTGRLGYAALGVGLAKEVLRIAIKYASERRAFGKRIADFQGVRWMLTDLYVGLEHAKRYLHWVAELMDEGKPVITEVAVSKLYSTTLAVKAARTAIQVHGGRGLERGSKLERMYRDSKALEIGEGTSEIMKVIIAKSILG